MKNISVTNNRRTFNPTANRSKNQENKGSDTGAFRYTDKEMLVKNKTIAQAAEIAAFILNEKRPGLSVNLDSIKNKNMEEKITLKELNEYVEIILKDSYRLM